LETHSNKILAWEHSDRGRERVRIRDREIVIEILRVVRKSERKGEIKK
jgi:hypothetical protein